MSEALKKVAKCLDNCVSEDDIGQPFMSSHSYKTHLFNTKYFRSIQNVESGRQFAFVDGGNFEIIGAPNFSVQYNRIYFNIFQGTTRILPHKLQQRIEFVSATYTAPIRNNEMFYDTTVVPLGVIDEKYLPDAHDLSFDSMDPLLTFGGARADISRVASIARRFAEWRFAERVLDNELRTGDVVVMDGTLRTAFSNESMYASSAYSSAKSKDVIFSGLSKSSRLFTTTGLSLLATIDKIARENDYKSTWWYHPIADSLSPEHQAAIFVVRLNEQAQYVFRYEIQADQAKELSQESLNEIFSQLSRNSCDLSFPGYPYGLIDADANARVTRNDAEPYRVMLLSEVSKLGSWSKFARQIRSVDAHGILDMLRGR